MSTPRFSSRTVAGALLLACFFILAPQGAKADTLLFSAYDPWGDEWDFIYTIGINKSVYMPGESIVATGQIISASCANGNSDQNNHGRMTAAANTMSKQVLTYWQNYGTETLTAQSTAGSYATDFRIELDDENSNLHMYADSSLTPYDYAVAVAALPYTVSSPTPTPPTATLSVDPDTVDSGGSANLTWSSTNASSCTAAGGFSTSGATSGTVSTGPVSTSQEYQVYCDGTGGRGYSSLVPLTVLNPSVTISAVPDRVLKGQSTTVSWSGTNVNTCTIKRNGVLWKSLTADESRVLPAPTSQSDVINAQTTYVITCTNNASENAATAIVNVMSSFQTF